MNSRDSNLSVRDFSSADWSSIWPIFRDVVAAGDTYVYDPDLSETEARALWIEKSPVRTSVAISSDGRVVGTAKMGPNKAGPGSHVATAAFMVDAHFRKLGVGRALALEALEWAHNAGFLSMQFNAVVETNERAVALWQSLGFEIVGTVPRAFRHPEHGLVGLHIMYLELPGP